MCAPSLLQRVVAENQGARANFEIYARNRELLLTNLQSFGYFFIKPEGAFYLFLAAPDGDGTAFSEAAKKYELLLTPSDSFGMKGYVRLSYCISVSGVGGGLRNSAGAGIKEKKLQRPGENGCAAIESVFASQVGERPTRRCGALPKAIGDWHGRFEKNTSRN